jgi:transcriptional/translational regulatory protein YebC/TACO1
MVGHSSKWSKIKRLKDALEEYDDVKEVFSNAEFLEATASA